MPHVKHALTNVARAVRRLHGGRLLVLWVAAGAIGGWLSVEYRAQKDIVAYGPTTRFLKNGAKAEQL